MPDEHQSLHLPHTGAEYLRHILRAPVYEAAIVTLFRT